METPLTNETARALIQALREQTHAVQVQTRAGLPQFFTLEDLCARYRLPQEQMKVRLIERGLIGAEQLGRGKRLGGPSGPRVHVDDVLKLDDVFGFERNGSIHVDAAARAATVRPPSSRGA